MKDGAVVEGVCKGLETRDDSLVKFREQVKASGGKIRVWVHPYYMGDDREYIPVMENIVSKLGEEKGVPNVFFMPGDQFFERDQTRILSLAKNGGDRCYFVKTQIGNPWPIIEDNDKTKAWDMVRNLFEDVGVTECLVGGETATKQEIETPGKWSATGCVNEAMSQLSVSFKVERSNAAFPVNRADVLKEGIKTK